MTIETIGPRTPVAVARHGVHVVLRIGSRSVALDYDTANRLAVLLRGQARMAKTETGDKSVRVVGFADLTDATLDEMRVQKRRDSTAAFQLR